MKRRKKNPGSHRHSLKWDRCVADVKKNHSAYNPYAVCTARKVNPKALSVAKQRAQIKRMLDWSRAALKMPDSKMPGGRMLHATARDEIAAARSRLAALAAPATNPKKKHHAPQRGCRRGNPGRWGILAIKIKNGMRFYYAGGARVSTEHGQAVTWPSRPHAERVLADILKTFPRSLTSIYQWEVWPIK